MQQIIHDITKKDPYDDIKEALSRLRKKQGLWKDLMKQISTSIEGNTYCSSFRGKKDAQYCTHSYVMRIFKNRIAILIFKARNLTL